VVLFSLSVAVVVVAGLAVAPGVDQGHVEAHEAGQGHVAGDQGHAVVPRSQGHAVPRGQGHAVPRGQGHAVVPRSQGQSLAQGPAPTQGHDLGHLWKSKLKNRGTNLGTTQMKTEPHCIGLLKKFLIVSTKLSCHV